MKMAQTHLPFLRRFSSSSHTTHKACLHSETRLFTLRTPQCLDPGSLVPQVTATETLLLYKELYDWIWDISLCLCEFQSSVLELCVVAKMVYKSAVSDTVVGGI